VKFTVLWQAKAEESLAEIWIDSTQRAAVTLAAKSIDDELREHPFDVGESRGGLERITFSGPLGAAFSISEKDCIVRVGAFGWCAGGRRKILKLGTRFGFLTAAKCDLHHQRRF
jgi:hypothetical protein